MDMKRFGKSICVALVCLKEQASFNKIGSFQATIFTKAVRYSAFREYAVIDRRYGATDDRRNGASLKR